MEDLSDDAVSSEADVLVVVAPENLGETEVFAIDQFLMRGGSVVLVTSPYISQFAGGGLSMLNRNSGLQDWLQHQGISVGKTLVLDPQNSAFPIPVTREVGGFRFQEVRMVDYPYFIDAREPGLNPQHPVTSGIPQITLAWASPIAIDAQANADRKVVELITSSDAAWTADDMDVLPRINDSGISPWPSSGDTGKQVLGALVSGRFESFFAGQRSPLVPEAEAPAEDGDNDEAGDTDLAVGSVIERSPESARLVVYASNDFLTDQILGTISSMTGAQYAGPLELMANTLDWALEDSGLLGIRSYAHYNRSLPPMDKEEQLFWEYLNYALAVLALALIALWQRRSRLARQQTYLNDLGGVA